MDNYREQFETRLTVALAEWKPQARRGTDRDDERRANSLAWLWILWTERASLLDLTTPTDEDLDRLFAGCLRDARNKRAPIVPTTPVTDALSHSEPLDQSGDYQNGPLALAVERVATEDERELADLELRDPGFYFQQIPQSLQVFAQSLLATVDEKHPTGNVSATADRLQVSRRTATFRLRDLETWLTAHRGTTRNAAFTADRIDLTGNYRPRPTETRAGQPAQPTLTPHRTISRTTQETISRRKLRDALRETETALAEIGRTARQ